VCGSDAIHLQTLTRCGVTNENLTTCNHKKQTQVRAMYVPRNLDKLHNGLETYQVESKKQKKKKQTYRGGEAVALDGRRNMQIVLLYIVFILGS
jgi:hypothetical protein